MRRGLFACFRLVVSDREETLGDVVKFLELGSNRETREKGFRLVEDVNAFLSGDGIPGQCRHASSRFAQTRKQMPLIKDPAYELRNSNLIFTPSGGQAFVFLIEPAGKSAM